MTKIAINGAAGKMGRRLVYLAKHDPKFEIVATIESDRHEKLSVDAGVVVGLGTIGVSLETQIDAKPDVVIDFSNDTGAQQMLEYCLSESVPLVVGTTGLSTDTANRILEAGHVIPVLSAPNMSLAVNLTMKLAQIAAKSLADNNSTVDVEIIEKHHRQKADSPSGTALRFGELIAGAMGQSQHRHGRQGIVGERSADEIGYHAIRAGDHPGQHTVLFGLPGESIELHVAATTRDCYAAGALAAAEFLANQAPGVYTMYDVLGLK